MPTRPLSIRTRAARDSYPPAAPRISEVAAEFGFLRSDHFARAFRHQLGHSARDVRDLSPGPEANPTVSPAEPSEAPLFAERARFRGCLMEGRLEFHCERIALLPGQGGVRLVASGVCYRDVQFALVRAQAGKYSSR
jgi:hypothetical protein